MGRPPGERRGGRTRKRRRRRERGGGREGERESGAWGAQVDRCTARSDFKHRATFTAGALKVRPPLRLSSSCVSAFKKAFPAAASAAGERTNHLTPGVLFFFFFLILFFWGQSFVRDRQSSEQAEKEEVDTSPGFRTAPHSSTERSAQESDPVRSVSPLGSHSFERFVHLSWLFSCTSGPQ